ncbi:MAG: Signal transduction histidine-protein kinase/phosphatase UhpB [Accumulibacter sp.]|nr:MAG: Signal transduction histidine-protein kinase/phosphatase UhpB [Accumulibacter sp.]
MVTRERDRAKSQDSRTTREIFPAAVATDGHRQLWRLDVAPRLRNNPSMNRTLQPASPVLEGFADSIAVLDERGVILSVNQGWRDFARVNGGSAELADGRGIDYLAAIRQAAASDVLAAAALQGLEEVLTGQQAWFTLEYPCHTPDSERWCECHAAPLAASGCGALVRHRQIRRHERGEAAVGRHHRLQPDLATLLDRLPSMIGYWDCRLRNRFANHAYRDWFGLDPATIPGKHIREVIGEERYRLNLPYIEAVLRGSAQQFERAIPSPDGHSLRHALARYIPDVVNGEVQGFVVEVMDVTSIKVGEQALQRAQEVGRLGSYTIDFGSGRWLGSPMLERILGLGPEHEHTTDAWLQIVHADDRQTVADQFRMAVGEAGVFDCEYRIVRPSDGAIRWLHGLGELESSAAGQPLRMIGTVQDITERKGAERATQALLDENTRLVRRLIALQERERADLARELHDELSQHLTAIRAFAGALQRNESGNPEAIRRHAAAIDDSARAIYKVSHRLMEGLHPSVLDSAGIAEALASLLENWGLQHPEIEWRASLPQDLVCEGKQLTVTLYRIAQECLSNVARHAEARRLRLILGTRQSAHGELLRLVIRDDGVGMDMDAAHAGFGLLGMRERVLARGGTLQVSSRKGGGTRVRVILPNA